MGTLRARKIRKEVYGERSALATPEGRIYRLLRIAKKIKDVIIYRDIIHADDLRKMYQSKKKASKSEFVHHFLESGEKSRQKALWCINRERLRKKRKEAR